MGVEITNERRSHLKMGAIFSVLTGVFLSFAYIGAVFLPAEIQFGILNHSFFRLFGEFDHIFVMVSISKIAGMACLLGLILNFYSLCREKNRALVSWVSVLAVIGISTSILTQFSNLNFFHQITRFYMNADQSVRDMINPLSTNRFDYEMMGYLFIGLWLFVISYLAITNKMIPLYLVGLGMVLGVLQILIFVTLIAGPADLMETSYLLFSILFVIWSVFEGLFLWKLYQQSPD